MMEAKVFDKHQNTDPLLFLQDCRVGDFSVHRASPPLLLSSSLPFGRSTAASSGLPLPPVLVARVGEEVGCPADPELGKVGMAIPQAECCPQMGLYSPGFEFTQG